MPAFCPKPRITNARIDSPCRASTGAPAMSELGAKATEERGPGDRARRWVPGGESRGRRDGVLAQHGPEAGLDSVDEAPAVPEPPVELQLVEHRLSLVWR